MTSTPPELPSAETLYNVYFAPWIPDEDVRAHTLRGDVEQVELPPGGHIRSLCPLTTEARQQVEAQLGQITRAARADLGALLERAGDPSLEWLERLETVVTPAKLQSWLRGSDPAKPDNTYLLVCCETGALIAEVLRREHPALRWLPDLPYFESALFDLNTLTLIPVFHWAIKTLSGDKPHPLRDKITATRDFLDKR